MRKVKFFCFFISFMMVFIVAVSALECTDSDGGENFMVKGTTTGVQDSTTNKIVTVVDSCLLGPDGRWYLQEYVCGEDGPSKDLIVGAGGRCDYGCEDGVCFINPATGNYKRQLIDCKDSDGTDNFNERGQIALVYDDGYSEIFDDKCGYDSGSGRYYGAYDYFCGFVQDNKPHYWSSLSPCKCEKGACLEENFILEDTSVSNIKIDEDKIEVSIAESSFIVKESFTEKGIEIISNDITISTQEKPVISRDAIKLAGTKLKLPEDIPEIFEEKTDIKNIELKLVENIPQYEINGKKKSRFLWLIPLKLRIKIQVDAEDGKIIEKQIEKPWWFIGS